MQFINFGRQDRFLITRQMITNVVDESVTYIFCEVSGSTYFLFLPDVLTHLNDTADWSRNGHHVVYNTVAGGMTEWLLEIDVQCKIKLVAHITNQGQVNCETYKTNQNFLSGTILSHPKFGKGIVVGVSVNNRKNVFFSNDLMCRT